MLWQRCEEYAVRSRGKVGMGRRPIGMRLERGRADCEEPGCQAEDLGPCKQLGTKERS